MHSLPEVCRSTTLSVLISTKETKHKGDTLGMRSGRTDGQFEGEGGQCGKYKTNHRNGGKEKTRIYRHRKIKMCNILIRSTRTTRYAATSVSQ